MPAIQKTRLNTPTSVGNALDLCQGFAMYPIGTLRAGVSGESWTLPLIDGHWTIGPYDGAVLQLTIGCDFFFGICGPAYATDLTVEGTATDTDISLTASASQTIAGVVIGAGCTPKIDIRFSGWAIDDFSYKIAAPQLDLIGIIIGKLLDKQTEGSDDEGFFGLPSGASSSVVDKGPNALAQTGKVSLRPEFYFIFDLMQFIPQLRPLLLFLKKVGGSFSLGPTFNIVLPFELNVSKFRTAGHEYTVTGGSSKFTGARTGAATVGADELEVELTHHSSVEFGLGIGFELCVLKLFSLARHSRPFDILALLKVHTTTSPITNALKARYGATDTAPPMFPEHEMNQGQEYEILFEDAEVEVMA